MSGKRTCDCKNCRTRPIAGTFKAINSTLEMIPGYKLLRFLMIILLIWVGLHYFTPEYDVPGVPFASCSAQAPEPTGLAAVAYDAGMALHTIQTSKPKVSELKQTFMGLAEKAGAVWGSFSAGTNADPIPLGPLTTKDPKARTVGVESCCTDTGGGGSGDTTISASAGSWSAEQRANAQTIVTVGRQRGASDRDLQVALMTAMQESKLQNLDYGSGQSIGLFQQIDAWGSFEQRHDPAEAARMFFEGGHAGQSGLFDIPGRDSMSLTQEAQAVQRSAFPDAYAQWEDDARELLSGPQESSSDAQNVSAPSGPSVRMPGLQPSAQRAADFVRATWHVDNIGGYATSGHITGSKHYEGLALDIMVPLGKTADAITNYFAGPGYKPFGVENVIHNHQIYNEARGWHAYTGSSPHTDHVHVDFISGDAGSGTAPAVGDSGTSQDCENQTISAAGAGSMRVGSLNVLGASHTSAHGERQGRADWAARWPGVPQLISDSGVSVIGFQEMQRPQFAAFQKIPGWRTHHAPGDTENSIAWRTDTWSVVEKRLVRVPYFYGHPRLMPLVKLRHTSGREVWFLNVHNPADVHGPAQRWRDEAVQREVAAIRHLDAPVVWVGDMNDRDRFGHAVRAAGLRTPTTDGIDWIVGSPDVGFTSYQRVQSGIVKHTTDHPFVFADLVLGTRS